MDLFAHIRLDISVTCTPDDYFKLQKKCIPTLVLTVKRHGVKGARGISGRILPWSMSHKATKLQGPRITALLYNIQAFGTTPTWMDMLRGIISPMTLCILYSDYLYALMLHA